MKKNSKIFIAGAQGMVGSAIIRRLRDGGYTNLMIPGRKQLDLLDQQAVANFFVADSPDYVIMAAAKVGGIHANSTYPAEFIHENLVIQSNVIEQAHRHHVKRLLFLGSSCIYPKKAPQPMSEDVLLTGLLEPTNEPYAIAKIAGIKMCESYNRQYGTQFVAVMPTNLYGPADNFHPENSHVLPALMRRFHEAKCERKPEVVVWGTGAPMREFLYVDDMADGCVFVMEMGDQALSDELLSYPKPCFVNLGAGMDVTIHELAETIKNVVGFAGEIVFDPSKPDGTMRKLLDVSRMKALGWEAKISLRDGIDKTYEWFLNHQAYFRA